MPNLPLKIKSCGKVYYIRFAEEKDANGIKDVMKESFAIYQDEIKRNSSSNAIVHALTETIEEIVDDIKNNTVIIALNGKKHIIGTIRVKEKSRDLAYIYRFGVLPEINNTGIGSAILGCVCEICLDKGFKAIALHTNSRFYTLARYYYGKRFFVHSTSQDKGYIRALFIKELTDSRDYDISPAFDE